MSVNAYRMKRNSSEYESPSFNVWHDEKLIDLLNEEILFYMCLNSFGTGVVDVPVELLEKAIGSAKKLELADDTVNSLESDIAFAKSNRDEIVTYYCF
jgi:hypothetical protein